MALLDISSVLRSRRALIAVAVAVPLLGAAIAVPRIVGGADAPQEFPVTPTQAARPAPQPATAAVVDAADAAVPEAHADDGPVPHAGGDLDVSVGLRYERYPSGSTIRADVSIANMSLQPFYVPSPTEPQPTLTVIVLNDAGEAVRRVVEEIGDTMPRRMRLLGSGDSTSLRIDVVAMDEEPLAPGTYQLMASYDTDPMWKRSGLPVWDAPRGVRHSDRVTLEVIAQ